MAAQGTVEQRKGSIGIGLQNKVRVEGPYKPLPKP